MEWAIYLSEKLVLSVGVLAIATSLIMYGRRSHDWKGIVTMFYKRIPLTVHEYKYYRAGVAMVIFAVILRIGMAVVWPTYSL